MIEAKIIKHSVNRFGDELITIQTKAPKFLDAEIEKHRMISSNSSSDRAIPFKKMIGRPVYKPNDVRLNERGMQGYSLVDESTRDIFHTSLDRIYNNIVSEFTGFENIHKQHLNRYLIGFTLQDKVMTANKDQWDYFLGLRLGSDADPAIQELSHLIKNAIDESVPSELMTKIPYHLPYVVVRDYDLFFAGELTLQDLIKISIARCARVSYLTHDNKFTDITSDLELYEFLITSKHLTPFEHVATPESEHIHMVRQKAFLQLVADGLDRHLAKQVLYCGNYLGWTQHRKDVECSFASKS